MDNKQIRAIGKRIRQIRLIDLEMTQADFAKAVGTGQARISLIEKGLVLPTMEVFIRITEIAEERTADWIINGQ